MKIRVTFKIKKTRMLLKVFTNKKLLAKTDTTLQSVNILIK